MAFLSETITKDNGIVLRWFPVTESSRVVVWFTENHGRISTLIRGSQRAKSWMLGQYDLFYTCEVLFYTRAREDLHILRECSPINPRSAFRTRYRNTATASYVTDILYRISPPRASVPELYHLATCFLDTLAGSVQPNPLHLFWFELQVYKLLGLAPHLEPRNPGPYYFDYRQGSVASEQTASDSRSVTEGSLALMNRLMQTEDPNRVGRIKALPGQIHEIAQHLDSFSNWHLELMLDSRARALEWITGS